jgi:hypothetical protein
MSYRVFYACDMSGCKESVQLRQPHYGFQTPDGWLRLFYAAAEFTCDNRQEVLICPEHAKMFPKILTQDTK